MYFRCLTDNRGDSFKATGGYYERVTDDGQLDTTESGLTKRSDVPEVCCSKSPAAALLGAIQNRQRSGTYYIYETREEPDVDVSGASARDFGLLEEVRYRPASTPVRFVLYETVDVQRTVVEQVQDAYGGRFSRSDVAAVKEKLAVLLDTGRYPDA